VEVFVKLALKNFAFVLSQVPKKLDKNCEKVKTHHFEIVANA
jgi:hypothetical protein